MALKREKNMSESNYKWAKAWAMHPEWDENAKTEEEKKQFHMLINPEIVIDFPVTHLIKDDLEALDEAYKIGAWYVWDEIISSLDSSTKIAKMSGKITAEQRKRILDKFYF